VDKPDPVQEHLAGQVPADRPDPVRGIKEGLPDRPHRGPEYKEHPACLAARVREVQVDRFPADRPAPVPEVRSRGI